MTRVLFLITVAFVLTAAALAWMQRTYLPFGTLGDVFMNMTPVLTLLTVLILVVSGFGTLGGLERDVARARLATITTVAMGVVGAVYGELNTHFGTLYDSEVTFATMAPGRIDSLAILALGLLGAALTLGILQLRGGVQRT